MIALSSSDSDDLAPDTDDVMTEATAPEIENALRAAISSIGVETGDDAEAPASIEMQEPADVRDEFALEEANPHDPADGSLAPEANAEDGSDADFAGYFAEPAEDERTEDASGPEASVSADGMDDDVPLFDDDVEDLTAQGSEELDEAAADDIEVSAAESGEVEREDTLAALTAALFAPEADDGEATEDPEEAEVGHDAGQDFAAVEDATSAEVTPEDVAPTDDMIGAEFNLAEAGVDTETDAVASDAGAPAGFAPVEDDRVEAEATEEDHIDEASREVFVAGSAAMAAQAAPQTFPTMDESDTPGRKPRIALMGEFSAGKSTLSNLLIGASPLPTRVTATQLPPVWISWGDGQAYREDLDGETHPIDVERIGEIDPSETRVIRLFCRSDILELCDIIDMPGISDPNMASDVWERVIGKADGVLWCTHATQAWRQSEAAVWESLDHDLFKKSLLLITRFDKLRNDVDRARVLKRVERETRDLFAERLPISLTEALSAGEDAEKWTASGAEAFTDRLVALLHDLSTSLGTSVADPLARSLNDEDESVVERPRSVQVRRQRSEPVAPRRVVPRRVRPAADGGARNAAF